MIKDYTVYHLSTCSIKSIFIHTYYHLFPCHSFLFSSHYAPQAGARRALHETKEEPNETSGARRSDPT